MITLWHNPRCSKSRDALTLIEASDHPFTIRKYLENSPTVAELKAVRQALGLPVIDMVRRGEQKYRELALTEADDETLLHAMAEYPILIKRPIALRDTRAVIGRPPDAVLSLL